jgi:PKD repeat protein
MFWKRWFRSRHRGASGSRTGPHRRSRLAFDVLEDRLTPATATSLLSIQPPATIGNGPSQTSGSSGSSFSGDGNLFVFSSDADNLVDGDTNAATDVFLKNLTTGAITRISIAPGGEQGNGSSFFPSISADGTLVAFQSYASNLIANDTNGTADIFVKNLVNGAITLVSADIDGNIGNNFSSQPAISADGRFVAFSSTANNLHADDFEPTQDVYRKSLVTGAVDLVSITADGTKGNIDSGEPAISADGAYVAFSSNADNLAANDVNSSVDVFRKNFADGTLTLVSANEAGEIGNANSSGPMISALGDLIAFTSSADNLIPNDNNLQTDVFVKALTSQTVTRVSVTASGDELNGPSYGPTMTGDGRYVAFASDANNAVSGDSNSATDVFRRDLVDGSLTLVSRNDAGGFGNAAAQTPALRGDGRAVAFTSAASNFTTQDTNGQDNVFLFSSDVPVSTPTIVALNAPASGIEGSPISFTPSVIDPGNPGAPGNLAYSWTVLKNGHTYATGAAHFVSFTPDDDAEYTFTLHVSNPSGNSAQPVSTTITVANVPPDLNIAPTATVDEGTPYVLSLAATDPGADAIQSWTINWGDGSAPETFPGTATSASHVYAQGPASWMIEVTATDEDGEHSANQTISVGGAATLPTVEITGNENAVEGVAYTIQLGPVQNFSSLPITGYRIEWGDGDVTTAAGDLPSSIDHIYVDGPLSPTITVHLLNGEVAYDNPAPLSLTVNDVPPVMTIDVPATVDEGSEFTVNFGSIIDPGDDPVASYTVNWGDGETSTGSGPPPTTLTHTYANGPATRTIMVSVVNDDGAFTIASATVEVLNVGPAFEAGGVANLASGGTLSRTITFTDPGYDDPTITVDYGAGDGPQSVTPTGKTFSLNRTYAAAGTYVVTIVIDDGTDSVTQSFEVHVADTASNTAPVVSAGDDASVPSGTSLSRNGSFTDSNDDTWTATVDYGDGDGPQPLVLSGKSFSLNHAYAEKGQFTVTVTINDGTTSTSDTFVVSVANAGPQVSITPASPANEAAAWSTIGSFIDVDADTWTGTVDFGDGAGPQPLTLADKTFLLSHTYETRGSYTVTVTVSDGTTTTSETTTATINNVAPTASIGDDAAVVTGQPFSRSGSFVDPGVNSWSATVDFGDGSGPAPLSLNSDKTFTLNHTYTTAGSFTVTVTVDDGATATTKTFSIAAIALDLALSKLTIVERSPAGTVVGTVTTSNSSLDAGATFTLVDDAGGRFQLSGRNLVVKDGTLLDRGTASTHTVKIRVASGGVTFDKEFSLQVLEGDKGDDFVGRDPVTGKLFVARSTGTSFVTTDYLGSFDSTRTWLDIVVGDFDGNGFDDVMGRDQASGEWWLAKNAGGSFTAGKFDSWTAGIAWANVIATDMNSDGKADLVARNPSTGAWRCSYSNGLNGETVEMGTWDATRSYSLVRAVDLNGDGRLDLVGFVPATGEFIVSFNLVSTENPQRATLNNLFSAWATLDDGDLSGQTKWVDVRIADIDGDGRLDYLGRVDATALWYVCYGTGGKPRTAQYLAAWSRDVTYAETSVGDVDGNGTVDLIGRVSETSRWVIAVMPAVRYGAVLLQTWGPTSPSLSVVSVGDFNRDGKTDIAGFRTGTWTVGLSSGSDFAFTDWDTWPLNPARIAVRRGKFAN